MSDETRVRLDTVKAPYGREIRLDEVCFESGMRLLRVTIREGRRITQLDLDADSAAQWSQIMLAWAERNWTAASRGPVGRE